VTDRSRLSRETAEKDAEILRLLAQAAFDPALSLHWAIKLSPNRSEFGHVGHVMLAGLDGMDLGLEINPN